jgi:N utilization substance protein A
MDYEILEALSQITREKNVDMDLVLETLEAGLKSATKKKLGTSDHIKVSIDRNTGEIAILATRKVVKEVEDKVLEISQDDARLIEPKAKAGQEIEEKLDFHDFGRNAIQAAKQILIQRIREAEREKIFVDYQDRIGEIITGTVQQVDRGNLIINLGRPEGIVPVKEQMRRERYRQGDTIRAYLLDVQKTTKGPQIMLSRTHPGFLEKLFEMEVPEIYEKIVEIKAIAREAGDRSKVAVVSNDARVDPVGACVGLRGIRVQNIVRELSNERIDIVPWSSDQGIFVTKAISPAKVSKIELDERERKMTLIVDNDQLSLAIGRAGQNVRLAAKLTGWKIDILSREEYTRRVEEMATMRVDISKLKGVGAKLAQELRKIDVESVQDLVKLDLDKLLQVPGVGSATAQKLLKAAKEKIAEVEEERLKVRQKMAEVEEAAAEEKAAEEKAAEEKAAIQVDISKLRGVSSKMAQQLRKIDVESVQDLAEIERELLLQVPGIGTVTAGKLMETAKEGLKQLEEARLQALQAVEIAENEQKKLAQEDVVDQGTEEEKNPAHNSQENR